MTLKFKFFNYEKNITQHLNNGVFIMHILTNLNYAKLSKESRVSAPHQINFELVEI